MTIKNYDSYKTIGEVSKILGLTSKKNPIPTHTIRFGKKNLNKLNQKY